MPVRIRPALPADAGEVGSLFAAHLAELALTQDPVLDADMADFPTAYDHPDACFLVAEAPGGSLAGMAGLLDGEVRRVFVSRGWRRQGMAKRLILSLIGVAGARTAKALQSVAPSPDQTPSPMEQSLAAPSAAPLKTGISQPGGPCLRAVVSVANQASRRLFLACGFVPTRRTPFHPAMQHCEILERSLPPVTAMAAG